MAISTPGDQKPHDHTPEKPPKRYWQAVEPFCDLKLSHWVEIILTVALVFVGSSQLYVYYGQAGIMRDQLKEMRSQSTIQRASIAARVHFEIIETQTAAGWNLTPRWTNAGNSDARDFQAWKDFEVFRRPDAGEKIKTTNFLAPLHVDRRPNPPTIFIPGDKNTYETDVLTLQDAADSLAGTALAIAWGHADYKDIFGTSYSVNYCRFFSFTAQGNILSIDMPHGFLPICEERKEQEAN